jgi:hypothetical protein
MEVLKSCEDSSDTVMGVGNKVDLLVCFININVDSFVLQPFSMALSSNSELNGITDGYSPSAND